MRLTFLRAVKALVALLAFIIFSAAPAAAETEPRKTIRGVYFTETGCSHCDAFLYAGRVRLEQEKSVSIELEAHDILSDSGYALCVSMLAERGLEFTSFPVLFVADAVYRGSTAIERDFAADIDRFLADGVWPERKERAYAGAAVKTASEGNEDIRKKMEGGAFFAAALPVLLAGLLDGVNPCAFSTLLFFLSFVSLRKKRKEAVLLTGVAFIAGVFVAYFFLGFGLLASLRAVLSAGRLAVYLNVAVSAAAAVLAALSLRDARLSYAARGGAGNGGGEEPVLKLPKPLRNASHAVIRRLSGGPWGIVLASLAGVAVSFIELACTGQIYLPTLAYLNRTAFSSRSALLLLAYNLAFVLPLVLVFVLFYFGLTHERIQAWYRRRIPLVRLLSAAFFVAVGVLVWIV